MTDNNHMSAQGKELFGSKMFVLRWWKWMAIVFVAACALSFAASYLITPRYKSTVVLFPTSSNRLSKAITADRYSMDYLDYGSERDCEYTLQILLSQAMETDVCDKFNLSAHYGIYPTDPHRLHKTHEAYRSNVSVKRTEFLGIEVSVTDVDPQFACDIANFMAVQYDSICRRIHEDRAKNALQIMDGVCQELEAEIEELDPKDLEMISLKREELAQMQTLRAQRKVDLRQKPSYKFWLDKASVSDKKDSPKRLIVMLFGGVAALLAFVLVLIFMEMCPVQPKPRKEKRSKKSEAPVEESPVEETPVEDIPVEDTPSEETPAEQSDKETPESEESDEESGSKRKKKKH